MRLRWKSRQNRFTGIHVDGYNPILVLIQHISAVTLSVRDMARSVDFYQMLGMQLSYGGRESGFTSFRAGQSFLNLSLSSSAPKQGWGRVIIRVNDIDSLFEELKGKGLNAESPRDGSWGERYFHLRDPDGHELSFAQLLS